MSADTEKPNIIGKPIGVLRMSIVNILCDLPCRLESLRLKFTNEPSIFVDGDLAESVKRSASDRLGDLVPLARARTFQGFSRHLASRHLNLSSSSHYRGNWTKYCTVAKSVGRGRPIGGGSHSHPG